MEDAGYCCLDECSTEYLEGYGACAKFITRMRNPYKAGAGPWSMERAAAEPDNYKLHPAYCDWQNGWNTRFYGEPVFEGGPKPY